MGWLSDVFKRKRGGTKVGNFIRSMIRNYTYGISDVVGLTSENPNQHLPEEND